MHVPVTTCKGCMGVHMQVPAGEWKRWHSWKQPFPGAPWPLHDRPQGDPPPPRRWDRPRGDAAWSLRGHVPPRLRWHWLPMACALCIIWVFHISYLHLLSCDPVLFFFSVLLGFPAPGLVLPLSFPMSTPQTSLQIFPVPYCEAKASSTCYRYCAIIWLTAKLPKDQLVYKVLITE